jgi:hypothetical protein
MGLRDLFARLWEATGAMKLGLLGAILFVIVDPPPTRRGAGRLVLIGFIFSIGAITGARWMNPQAENFAAIAGGVLGGVLAPRLLAWARAATISDLLAALGRTAPRPPPGARPPDPPPTQTTEPNPPAA